jgi:hypothetical protein
MMLVSWRACCISLWDFTFPLQPIENRRSRSRRPGIGILVPPGPGYRDPDSKKGFGSRSAGAGAPTSSWLERERKKLTRFPEAPFDSHLGLDQNQRPIVGLASEARDLKGGIEKPWGVGDRRQAAQFFHESLGGALSIEHAIAE